MSSGSHGCHPHATATRMEEEALCVTMQGDRPACPLLTFTVLMLRSPVSYLAVGLTWGLLVALVQYHRKNLRLTSAQKCSNALPPHPFPKSLPSIYSLISSFCRLNFRLSEQQPNATPLTERTRCCPSVDADHPVPLLCWNCHPPSVVHKLDVKPHSPRKYKRT